MVERPRFTPAFGHSVSPPQSGECWIADAKLKVRCVRGPPEQVEARLCAGDPASTSFYGEDVCRKNGCPATSADMTGMRPDEAARTLPFVAKMLRTVLSPARLKAPLPAPQPREPTHERPHRLSRSKTRSALQAHAAVSARRRHHAVQEDHDRGRAGREGAGQGHAGGVARGAAGAVARPRSATSIIICGRGI